MATISGGGKLQARLDEVARFARKAATLRVGFLENASYPHGGISVATVAAIQEFGAPRAGIPPRPFFRNMVAAKSKEWPKAVATLMKFNNYDASRTLRTVGEAIKGQLQQSIVDTNDPPLTKVTLMVRKMRIGKMDQPITYATVAEARRRVAAGESTAGVSIKPLVWSGHLLHSVDFEVK